MNKIISKFSVGVLVTACSVLFLVGNCLAGAWTLGKGKIYDRLAINYYYANKEFDNSGDKRDFANHGDFRDFNLNNYLEYGLTDRVTLINSLYYKYIRKDDDTVKMETYSPGNIDLGAKFRLYEGSLGVLSAQTMVKIPEAYDKNDPLPVGNGQYDFEARLLYGRSLYPLIPGYCNFEVGYRWRFGDPSDEIRYLAEFGTDFSKDFYGRVKLDGIYSMDNGAHMDTSGNPTTTNNFDIGKLDMVLGYKMSKQWGMEFGYTPAIYGQNTALGATYSVAVAYQTP
ncbi:MAG: hypothetical protein Q8O44_05795 [Syntrophales bacterium]|nr:hypothetical protein [Syntrophales bacterium]